VPRQGGSMSRLIPAYAIDPHVVAGQNWREGQHLASLAAGVGICLPEVGDRAWPQIADL